MSDLTIDTQENSSPSQELLEAREVGQRLNTQYPGWKDSLPDCPCTEVEIENDPRFSESQLFVETYHPGADTAYRSGGYGPFYSSLDPSLPPLNPGQQCTFQYGLLVTTGPGAGTPDAFSPSMFSFMDHRAWDVLPANHMTWEEYQTIWTPNNDKQCPEFFVGPEPQPDAQGSELKVEPSPTLVLDVQPDTQIEMHAGDTTNLEPNSFDLSESAALETTLDTNLDTNLERDLSVDIDFD